MLTYRTTREVRALYFDGMSASLMGEGTMSQMVFLFNASENVPRRTWPGRPGRRSRRPDDRVKERQSDGMDAGGCAREQGIKDRAAEANNDKPDPGHWNPLEDEYLRARGLCDWLVSRGLGGRGWGFEAVVRMNAGFEVIWCDFASESLLLVSNLNVSAPRLEAGSEATVRREGDEKWATAMGLTDAPEGPHGPGMVDPREPFKGSATWMWFAAAARRYFGEARAKVDTCGLFSFYDPELRGQGSARVKEEMEGLNLTSEGRWISPKGETERKTALTQLVRRRSHHLGNVSKGDGVFMRQAVEKRLKNVLSEYESCSGINWHRIAQEVIETYSTGLRNLRDILSQSMPEPQGDWLSFRERLASIRALTHWFLMPSLECPHGRPYARGALEELFNPASSAAKAAFERCQNHYAFDTRQLADGEDLLSVSMKETLAGICGTIVEIGMDIEYAWLANFNKEADDHERKAYNSSALVEKAESWRDKTEELVAWLGWADQEATCATACSPGEICYIPMWPVAGFPGRGRPHKRLGQAADEPPDRPRGPSGWEDAEKYLWEPVCINASSYPP